MKTLASAIAIAGLMTTGAFAQMQPQTTQPGGAAPGGSMAYCLQNSDGARNCGFQTMASCEAAKKGQAGECVPNPASTTGSGAATPGSPNGAPMQSPGGGMSR